MKTSRLGIVILLGVTLTSMITLAFYGPVSQSPGYNLFAERATILGVPNFWNVVSNVAFLFSGVWGLLVLRRATLSGLLAPMRVAWLSFFISSVLIGFGSAYYHASPTDATLAWDRLPMTVAFMSLLAIVLGEQVNVVWGMRLLPGLLIVGVASIGYWRLTGDLRLYILVQYLPMILIPLALILFKPSLRPRGFIWAGLLVYAMAKAFDVLDDPIYQLLGAIGGHPFKHVVAAVAIGIFVLAILRRHPVDFSV